VKLEAKYISGAIMALQAPVQGRKPGPRKALLQTAFERDLELQDTAQSLPVERRRPMEQTKCLVDLLSPFDLARQKAYAQLPPRWNKRPHPLGLAVTELKAALALLTLHQHALLLNKTAEEVEDTELIGAALVGFGGNRKGEDEMVGSRSSSMAPWTKSKGGGCHVTVAEEEKEIELLFEQLWDIPQHLGKPPPRVATYISPHRSRVRGSPPPPPLPPEKPALCYLGVEEIELVDLESEEEIMADRGRGGRNRGRGSGGGRGDNWNRQQHNSN
jgi:hypothetical protein